MTKVLIADDHSAIRNGVKHILSSSFPFMEFNEAKDAGEIYVLLKDHRYDLLILDIDLPGRNGFEVLHTLKTNKYELPVLVFSFHKEDQIALRAYKNGAYGFLSKDTADKELIDAVNLMLAGKKYLPSGISEQLLSYLKEPELREPHEKLSDREYQTMLMIAKGKTVSQIAQELLLSTPTVSTYRARILEKMDLKNNAEIASYAIKKNLV